MKTIILIIALASLINAESTKTCDNKNCESCKTTDKNYCLSCKGNSTEYKTHYAYSGKCYECSVGCVQGYCKDDYGCKNCTSEYHIHNSSTGKHPGNKCKKGSDSDAVNDFLKLILIIFVVCIVFIVVCVAICVKMMRKPKVIINRVPNQQGNVYHVPPRNDVKNF